MPNIRDFVNGRNIVILHSNIRVVHRPAADVRYLSSARMLCTLHSKISEKVKVKGRKSLAFINYLEVMNKTKRMQLYGYCCCRNMMMTMM